MGFGILRQVRSVKNTNCWLAKRFETYFNACEGFTRVKYEDTTPAYSVGWKKAIEVGRAKPAYIYHSAEQLQ
ncbi:unnamed protein product, partial [Anisakis simplex]|uniref:PKD_channel domain-containing protein n=1 Tax=Anisakis simplex TaxID=6269 RepID=A0A0M3JQM1_ANISI